MLNSILLFLIIIDTISTLDDSTSFFRKEKFHEPDNATKIGTAERFGVSDSECSSTTLVDPWKI